MSTNSAVFSESRLFSQKTASWKRAATGAAISVIACSLAAVSPGAALSLGAETGALIQAANVEIAKLDAESKRQIGLSNFGSSFLQANESGHAARILIAEKRSTGGLAGSEGEVRKKFMAVFGGSDDPCGKMYKAYVAAPGHSAFAATAYVWGAESVLCVYAVNAPSKKTAEDAALSKCNAGFKHYKDLRREAVGKCEIYASK